MLIYLTRSCITFKMNSGRAEGVLIKHEIKTNNEILFGLFSLNFFNSNLQLYRV